MAALVLKVNGERREVEADPATPLLWVLREQLRMTGTKFGCGVGMCGACTVHLDGAAARSCQTKAREAVGCEVTTIEGVPEDHPLKKAWVEHQVPQCGYCQSGQLMQAASLLAANPHPSDDELHAAMRGNLCRCSAYVRIRRAIKSAAGRQP